MDRAMRQWVQALPIISCLAGSCATTRHTAMSIYLEARSISTLPKSKRGSWFGADATTDYKSLEPLCLYAWDMHGQTPKIVQFILAMCSMQILSLTLSNPLFCAFKCCFFTRTIGCETFGPPVLCFITSLASLHNMPGCGLQTPNFVQFSGLHTPWFVRQIRNCNDRLPTNSACHFRPPKLCNLCNI